LIAEQLISHEELLAAVHEASIHYVEADSALRNYRSSGAHPAKLEQLKRNLAAEEQALREAQTQLLLSNPR
jgi:hypothetical protein